MNHTSMKAMVLEQTAPINTRPLSLQTVERPLPQRGQVLVRVVACGVCRTDLHVIEADLPSQKLPLIPGHQVVGYIEEVGAGVDPARVGERVGVAWLHRSCGDCEFCKTDRENLCDRPAFTGWTEHGGFAEYMVADAEFSYALPEGMDDVSVAPLLCAGIIGYRCLKLSGIRNWNGATLGIYGFGAAGHVAIQIAQARGARVFVCTRDVERHQALAKELGAVWTGGSIQQPPELLDAAIVFAPAGELVPPALLALKKGGSLVLGGIHMSDIPSFPYGSIYRERLIRTVANNTRADALEFLDEANTVGVKTHVQEFSLAEANEALHCLKHDAIKGAAVIRVVSKAV